MKKLVLLLLAVCMCLSVGVLLTACGDSGETECQHSFALVGSLVEATCTESGYYETQCTLCGEAGENNVIHQPRGHSRTTSPVYNNDDTCTTNGTESYVCSRCNETITTEVPDTAKHVFDGTRDCMRCEDGEWENKYLKFDLNTAGTGYIVYCDPTVNPNNDSSALDNMSIINIPSEYNGLPVVEIKDDAFDVMATFESYVAYIPASVERIGNDAFNGCDFLREIVFEEGSQLKSIGERAFGSTLITELILPEGTADVDELAFKQMSYLTCLTLPSTLEAMPNLTGPQYCGLRRLNTVINNSDFTEDDILEAIGGEGYANKYFAVRESNPNRTYIAKSTLNHGDHPEKDVRLQYIHLDGENILIGISPLEFGEFSDLEIPMGITYIESSAIEACDDIRGTLVIPNSVKKINKDTTSLNFGSCITFSDARISINETTDISDFDESAFKDSNEVSHLILREDTSISHGTVKLDFANDWSSIVENGYVWENSGVKVSFIPEPGYTVEGTVHEHTSSYLGYVTYSCNGFKIKIELTENTGRVATEIVLRGHDVPIGNGIGGTEIDGFWWNESNSAYSQGIDAQGFTTNNNAFSDLTLVRYGENIGSGDWYFAIDNDEDHAFYLAYLTVTLDAYYNADLTAQ